jgi:hypothetical protein
VHRNRLIDKWIERQRAAERERERERQRQRDRDIKKIDTFVMDREGERQTNRQICG